MEPCRGEARAFPEFALQSVADAHHAWSGMMVHGDGGGSDAMARLFGEFGLGEALGPLVGIVPWREIDDGETMDQLPPQRLAVLVPQPADATAAAKLRQWRQAGFALIHQVDADGGFPADAIALAWDARAGNLPPSMAEALHRLPGPHLALSVDHPEDFVRCQAAGFTWVAGDYPLHNASVNFSRGHGPAHAVLLKLLGLVAHDADTREIEAVLKQDPQLSFQLLRLVNSAAMAHPTRIGSFNQAITMLGRRQLQRWLQLLLYAHPRGPLSPLLPRAAYRARFMETLCAQRGGTRDEQDRAFMTGVFSLLDALFGRPLAELLRPLDLPPEIVAALLEDQGPLARLLAIARCERIEGTGLHDLLGAVGLGSEQLAHALVAACHWSIRVGRE
jgi:EAL and modified HD-GYP domain-containing signal transduction protein